MAKPPGWPPGGGAQAGLSITGGPAGRKAGGGGGRKGGGAGGRGCAGAGPASKRAAMITAGKPILAKSCPDMMLPPWGSPLCQFLFGVTIQRSPPPPLGASARQIPRAADDRGESDDRDEGIGSPGRAIRRGEPKAADEPED